MDEANAYIEMHERMDLRRDDFTYRICKAYIAQAARIAALRDALLTAEAELVQHTRLQALKTIRAALEKDQ